MYKLLFSNLTIFIDAISKQYKKNHIVALKLKTKISDTRIDTKSTLKPFNKHHTMTEETTPHIVGLKNDIIIFIFDICKIFL